MNSFSAVKDGQAPARRFGGCIAVVIVTIICICVLGIWFFFAGDSLKILKNSFSLQSKGVTTDGTVIEAEEQPGVRPNSVGGYILTVEYEVDGQTYTITSSSVYHAEGSSWVGRSMPIIYDPNDPSIALIDNFQERWFNPFTNVLP